MCFTCLVSYLLSHCSLPTDCSSEASEERVCSLSITYMYFLPMFLLTYKINMFTSYKAVYNIHEITHFFYFLSYPFSCLWTLKDLWKCHLDSPLASSCSYNPVQCQQLICTEKLVLLKHVRSVTVAEKTTVFYSTIITIL